MKAFNFFNGLQPGIQRRTAGRLGSPNVFVHFSVVELTFAGGQAARQASATAKSIFVSPELAAYIRMFLSSPALLTRCGQIPCMRQAIEMGKVLHSLACHVHFLYRQGHTISTTPNSSAVLFVDAKFKEGVLAPSAPTRFSRATCQTYKGGATSYALILRTRSPSRWSGIDGALTSSASLKANLMVR